jgi:hypothetical protein
MTPISFGAAQIPRDLEFARRRSRTIKNPRGIFAGDPLHSVQDLDSFIRLTIGYTLHEVWNGNACRSFIQRHRR